MAALRSTHVLWNNVQTGAAGVSAAQDTGQRTNVVVYITVNGATTVSVEVAPGVGGAGRNSNPTDDAYYPLFDKTDTKAIAFVFAGAGSFAIDMSPFGAEYIRLKSTNDVLATATLSVVG